MKVPVNSIRAGNVIEYNGKLWIASKVEHISPGKGGAFVAIEAKALREGNKLQERFRSGETIEHVHIDERANRIVGNDFDQKIDALGFGGGALGDRRHSVGRCTQPVRR